MSGEGEAALGCIAIKCAILICTIYYSCMLGLKMVKYNQQREALCKDRICTDGTVMVATRRTITEYVCAFTVEADVISSSQNYPNLVRWASKPLANSQMNNETDLNNDKLLCQDLFRNNSYSCYTTFEFSGDLNVKETRVEYPLEEIIAVPILWSYWCFICMTCCFCYVRELRNVRSHNIQLSAVPSSQVQATEIGRSRNSDSMNGRRRSSEICIEIQKQASRLLTLDHSEHLYDVQQHSDSDDDDIIDAADKSHSTSQLNLAKPNQNQMNTAEVLDPGLTTLTPEGLTEAPLPPCVGCKEESCKRLEKKKTALPTRQPKAKSKTNKTCAQGE